MARLRLKRNGLARTKDRALKYDHQRVRRERWIDPFPSVHGTLPEKMVYAELSHRRIPFLFLNDVRFAFPEIDFDKEYQADFVIPDLKIIIEVNGSYWHSKPGAPERDAFKYAVYEMGGYQILAWWDYDIISNIYNLFAQNSALASRNPSGITVNSELPVAKRTKVDTSKGIRTLNRRRALRKAYKRPAVRQRFKRNRRVL